MASSPPPMETSTPPSSPPPPPPPLALPAPPSATVASSGGSSRRLPPPCWSHDETVALIDSYCDKWYSLRRGNLKATHWQEVADAVSSRCPSANPPKTAVQCRHKMEKLRKRYRTEIQRARSMPVSRFTSSWVHFKRMDAMEKGPNAKPENSSGDDDNDEDDDEDHDLYEDIKNGSGGNMRSIHKLYRNGVGNSGGSSSGSGFRIRIPTVSIAQPGTKFYGKMDHQRYTSNPNVGYGVSDGFGARVNVARPVMAKREKEKEKDPVAEMVAAIKVLGDGFVRMEQMKMEMAREIETMRMEMEMKRTEMILESQQRIVEAFAQAVAEKRTKKLKRFPSPDA